MKMNRILILALIIVSFISVKTSNAQVGAVVAVTGSIFNAVTHDPETVFMVIIDENGKKISATRSNSAENGYYYIPSLKPGKKYFVTINQPEFLKEKFEIEIPNESKYAEISRDFLVTPSKLDEKIPVPVPPFELNKSKLRVGSDDILDDLKATLVNNPSVKVNILCYPDNGLDQDKNKQLTDERSKTLMNYFVTNGIDASRITASGSATPDPKNPPPTTKKAKGKRYIGPSYLIITQL